jgi:hypothetical protein
VDGFDHEARYPVSGVVLDGETLQPVAGATVRLALDRHLWPAPMAEREPVTSDEQGAFQMSHVAAGSHSFLAVAPGYAQGGELDVQVPPQEPVRILLDRQSLILGQVVDDATGAPVAGAELLLYRHGHVVNEGTPEHTDDQGRFTLRLGHGEYHLTAKQGDRAGAYPGRLRVGRHSERDGLIIRLSSAGSLSGRVSARSSREPLERLFVAVQHVGSGMELSAVAEPDGRYRMENLAPGEYSVNAEARGLVPLKRGGVHLKGGQHLTVDLVLLREASVEGTITDVQGRPVAHASVSAKALDSQDPEGWGEYPWASNEEGHYRIERLAPGRYLVQAQSPNEGPVATRELTLTEGQIAKADFTITDTSGHVEGVVRRATGEPLIHDVTISADSDDESLSTGISPSQEGARFRLTLKPGTYVLTAEYADVGEPGPEQRVTVETGKTVQVVLTVPDGAVETSGIVLDSRGEPAPKAMVALSNDELDASDRTDERGRFTMKTPARSAGAVVTLTAELGPESTTVENVRVGSGDQVLRLRQASSLKGRILPQAGGPVSGFTLTVTRRKDATVLFGNRSFVGDTFTLSALPAEELDLLVRTKDGRSGRARVRLEPGAARELELLVGGLGRVVGRLVNASAAPEEGTVYLTEADETEHSAESDEEGRFELFGIPPGAHVLEYTLYSSESEETSKHPITLRPGETLNVGDLGPKPATAQPVP